MDLFFSLSGFIFFWLYSEKVHARRISARNFFVLRFSRLYPLHLLTLLAVAAIQAALFSVMHGSFVYEWNDAYHFLLNLLFMSSWGLEHGYSFNAPVWSVSVEVFLYLVFFTLCRLLRARAVVLALLAAAGFFLVQPYYAPLGRGISSFFTGGCMYLLYDTARRRDLVQKLAWPLLLLTIGLWVTAGYAIWLRANVDTACRFVLFPTTILALALVETGRAGFATRLAFLGDISYSSYLLHFPLQLTFIIAGAALGVHPASYYSTTMFLTFFAVLLGLSWCSFHFFEVPVQKRIRRRWLSGS